MLLYFDRSWLTEYSLPRARDRILKERVEANQPESTKLARLQEVQRLAKGLAPHCRYSTLRGKTDKLEEPVNRELNVTKT